MYFWMMYANNDRALFSRYSARQTRVCVLSLFFLSREDKKKKWYENAKLPQSSNWLEIDWKLFSLFFAHSLSRSFFFLFVLFFGIFIYSFILSFFSAARVSRVFYIVKKRIKVWADCLFFLCLLCARRLKFERDMKWHKSRSTNEKMMFVHTSVCIEDDN
jgi:hypothetical protein